MDSGKTLSFDHRLKMKIEERLIDFEMRITHQDDMIDELNKTVYQQQLKIDRFETILKEMASRIIELENNTPLNEKPPHY